MVIVERHPVQVPYVAKIVLVNTLTKNLTLGNRMEFRAVNRGDADGDTLNMFPIPKKWALEFKAELERTLAMTGSVIDSALHVRGVSIAEDADTWAENPFKDGKTVEKKLSQEFVMSCDEWLAKHETMQGYANKYTPLAYRLSDIGAAMASLGDEAGRTAGLIGAIVEEDFYLGLTGGPAALDMAMEAWFSKPDSAKMRREVFSGLDTVLRPDLMTTPVRIAVMEAARINQGYFDPYDAKDVLVHYSFLIGKGMTTSGKPDGLVGIRSVYAGLMQLAQNKKLRETNRFLVNIGLYAAERLAPVLEAKREDNDWSSDDEDELTL
jgi:hypothetical protein